MSAFKRVIKSGWQGFSRDGGLVLANIFILVLTISVITSLFLFKESSKFIMESLREKVDVSVYFKYDVSEEEILDVQKEIASISEVKSVSYVSRDEALEVFVERHKDDPVLLESLEEVGINPFLASLDVKAFEASQYETLAALLESFRFESLVEKVDYHERKPVIDKIYSLTSNFNVIGIAVSLLFAIIAALVTFNTIRLAIYSLREEIKIQRLVGASNWFIRGPFLFQGAVAGGIAALGCLLFFTLLTFVLSSKIEVLFPGLNVFVLFVSNFWLILLLQLVSGVGLGIVSSSIAVRRYLET
ncbi:MAG: permease-like cell division protein FtsX [bacterium]|nr:permease-like cell division protein FtsX [bacterium]